MKNEEKPPESGNETKTEKEVPPAKTAVVVEDDWVTIKLLEHMLVQSGFKVFSAFDGLKGWELIQSHQPDLIVCDMLIPKIHGIEVCRKTKADPSLKNIPVILMTGVYKGLSYNREIKDAGADGFLEKPIDVEEFTRMIRKLL